MTDAPLLSVFKIQKTFRQKLRWSERKQGTGYKNVFAVDKVSFSLEKGETLGIIGESGCGKSTTARILVGLVKPDAGSLIFQGKEIFDDKVSSIAEYRRDVQIVFQDPYEYLNPRMYLKDIICEPLVINKQVKGENKIAIAAELLEHVGLAPPDEYLYRFTHELSGGQRQRVAIARALALRPKLLIADEPTSMLDVSVRAGILNLLKGLILEHRMSMIFITHDIATAGYMCDRIAVMYKGRIVEIGNRDNIISAPEHPYTKALVQVCDDLKGFIDTRESYILEGEVDAFEQSGRCCFSARCVCRDRDCHCQDEGVQELVKINSDHYVACAHCR